MPFYNYTCTHCGDQHELNLPIADRDAPTLEECPACGQHSVTREAAAPFTSYEGAVSMHKRAGNGWKEVQQKIKATSGKANSIYLG